MLNILKLNISLVLFAFLGLTMQACQNRISTQEYKATSTSAAEMESPDAPEYVIHQSPDKTPLFRGQIKTENVSVIVDSAKKSIKIQGMLLLSASKKSSALKESFELEGPFDNQGFSTLVPAKKSNQKTGEQNQEEKHLDVRAKTTCLEADSKSCKKIIADIFVHDLKEDKFHVTQVQANLTNSEAAEPDNSKKSENKKSTQELNVPPPKDKIPENPDKTNPTGKSAEPNNSNSLSGAKTHIEKKEDNDAHDDEPLDEAKEDLYVGQIYTDFKKIFELKEGQIDKIELGRPFDQSVGSPIQGSLRNSTNLVSRISEVQSEKNMKKDLKIVIPQLARLRTFGSFELVEVILKMADINIENQYSPAFFVSDLSEKNGGAFKNSSHQSHQNGLDVDLSYFIQAPISESQFPNIVIGDKIRSDFNQEKWLKFMMQTMDALPHAIDRVFVNQTIKNQLCVKAKTTGLLDGPKKELVTETLRRLRPWKGHGDHFHLRIKCSKYQRLCKQMVEPPAGTGCP